jgi:hypothetical protein
MKHSILLLCMLTFLLPSCKKSDDNNPTGSAGGKRLVKELNTDGQSSGTSLYFYDANGKLAGYHREIVGNGPVSKEDLLITRNAAGMIEKIRSVDRGDTFTTNVSSSSQRYTNAERNTAWNPSNFSFKVNFVYDNSGHIVQVREVYDFGGSLDVVEDELTYQGNNLSTVKVYEIRNGTKNLLLTYEYVYDNKNNPLPFGDEWILFSLNYKGIYQVSSANNVIKATMKYASTPDQSDIYSYDYNDQNLPIRGTFKPYYRTQPISRIYIYE